MQLTAVLKKYTLRGFQQTLSRAMNAFGYIEGVTQHQILAGRSFRAHGPSAGASYCIQPVTTSRPLQFSRSMLSCRNFASSQSELRTDAQPLLVDPEALRLPRYCAGCGVGLQAEDPDLPGCVLKSPWKGSGSTRSAGHVTMQWLGDSPVVVACLQVL
jgi:hypothetical protein